jgi:hypothetical protein
VGRPAGAEVDGIEQAVLLCFFLHALQGDACLDRHRPAEHVDRLDAVHALQ